MHNMSWSWNTLEIYVGVLKVDLINLVLNDTFRERPPWTLNACYYWFIYLLIFIYLLFIFVINLLFIHFDLLISIFLFISSDPILLFDLYIIFTLFIYIKKVYTAIFIKVIYLLIYLFVGGGVYLFVVIYVCIY